MNTLHVFLGLLVATGAWTIVRGAEAAPASTGAAAPPEAVSTLVLNPKDPPWGFSDKTWDADDALHAYYLERFIQSANFGNLRMSDQSMQVDDGMRLILGDNAAVYSIDNIELIGLAMHPKPAAFVTNRHVRRYGRTELKQTGTTRELTETETKALEILRSGRETAAFEEKSGDRVMVGAVRAQQLCLECHGNFKAGDLLGAFSYTLKKAGLKVPAPARLASLPPQPAKASATRPLAAPSSAPAVKDGVALVIGTSRDVFSPAEPLVIKTTLRNVSEGALRLPNNLALYGDWLLRMEDVETGKVFTVGYYFSGGQTQSAAASTPLNPGDALTTSATYGWAVIVEGALDYDAFHAAAAKVAPSRGSGPRPPASFLPGTFNLRLIVRFPNQVIPDANDTPVWKNDAIASNPIQVKVGSFPVENTGSITGIVVDRFGRPAAHAKLSTLLALPLNPWPPVPNSGYAKAVGGRPTYPAVSRPGSTTVARPDYANETPAGETDENGVFVISNLPPGTYGLKVALPPADLLHRPQTLTKQAIEVRAGEQVRQAEPLKLDYGSYLF